MLPINSLYTQIEEASKYLHDPELRKKLYCLLRGVKTKDVDLACQQFGISRSTFYTWLRRLTQSDFDPNALLPQSKRPHGHPRQIERPLQEAILEMREGFRYGPKRIAWYMKQIGFSVSAHGVYNVLQRACVVFRKRRDQKVNRHKKRYVLSRPGEGLQLDIKYVPFLIEETKTYVFSAVDDCSRWRFSYGYQNLGVEPALDFVKRLVKAAPFPIDLIQTDNDVSFTNRFLPKCPDYDLPHAFSKLLETLQILHKLIPPGIKELNGKIERLHKTDDEEFYWKLSKDISFESFQRELERWDMAYNQHRPHSELDMKTPTQRLEEFGIRLNTTQQLLTQHKHQEKMQLPIALHFALKLNALGKNDTWFRNQLPHRKKRLSVLQRAEVYANLSSTPLPPLCGMCGNTTA